MIDGSGLFLVLVVAVCLVIAIWGLSREVRHPAGHEFRRLRLAAGLSLMAAAIAGGQYVIRPDDTPREEVRGYGVVVEGVSPTQRRGFDVGLALAQSVTIESCDADKPVEVTLQIAPTAEFWIDNFETLGGSIEVEPDPDKDPTRTTVSVLIPAADAALQEVSQGLYGMDPFTRPADNRAQADDAPDLTVSESTVDDEVRVDVEVTDWAANREPLRITYTADLVERRGLGSCSVELPALTGLPTVISGARLAGAATTTIDDLVGSDVREGLFIVTSASRVGDADEDDGKETSEAYAYYDPRFEITRGVTVLDLSSNLSESESAPTPDATFSGAPAWTCRSTVASKRLFIEDEATRLKQLEADAEAARRAEAETPSVGATASATVTPTSDDDPYFTTSRESAGTYALSQDRIDEVLEQNDCAAQARLQEKSAQSKRDVVVMFVGAMFSAGVAWATTSVRRRRAGPARAPAAAASPPPTPSATMRMLTTMSRARRSRRPPPDGETTRDDPPRPPHG